MGKWTVVEAPELKIWTVSSRGKSKEDSGRSRTWLDGFWHRVTGLTEGLLVKGCVSQPRDFKALLEGSFGVTAVGHMGTPFWGHPVTGHSLGWAKPPPRCPWLRLWKG